MSEPQVPFIVSLLSGSAAGTAVDMSLYPLDTIKTRLQSQQGFWKSGGFSGIYRGIGPAFLGAAPNAAVFFCTYDQSKILLQKSAYIENPSLIHMLAACLGEITACIVRVPVEIVKQRRQAFGDRKASFIFSEILKNEGVFGFYRGYFSTVLREIPFSILQFPLWELLKAEITRKKGVCLPWDSAVCGAIAGGFSAAATTPLDVAKTRIMLADVHSPEAKGNVIYIWKMIHREKGFKGLFAGVVPRTLWISLGGSIFFGTYELVKQTMISL